METLPRWKARLKTEPAGNTSDAKDTDSSEPSNMMGGMEIHLTTQENPLRLPSRTKYMQFHTHQENLLVFLFSSQHSYQRYVQRAKTWKQMQCHCILGFIHDWRNSHT